MPDDEHQDSTSSAADPETPPQLMLLCMRLAVTLQKEQESCAQRACRRTKRCHMVIDASGARHCGAKFNLNRAGYDAATMIFFLDEFRCAVAGQPWSRYDRALGDPAKRRRSETDAAR